MYIMIRVNVTVNSNGKLNLFVFMIPSQAGAIPRFGHTGAGVGAGGGWLREGGPAPPARLLAPRKPRLEGSGKDVGWIARDIKQGQMKIP